MFAIALVAGSTMVAGCGIDQVTAPQLRPPATPVDYPIARNVSLPGSPVFDKIRKAGTLVVGVKDDQPGLSIRDVASGRYAGFDIEIAKLVAAGLGFGSYRISYVPVDSAAREQAISNGDVDYYVGAYTITDKRKQQVSFAGPYFTAGQDLLVRADDNTITGKDGLHGKRVCSVTGSTSIQRVRDLALTEPRNISEFQKYSECVDRLVAGQTDAVTADNAVLAGYAAQEPDAMKLVGKTFSVEPYGVGLAKDDKVLRDAIDDVLEKAVNDGTWRAICDRYFGVAGVPVSAPAIVRY
ncbi:transporter substrate-binding domain-containing protein [Amycolatopsis sp. RM579]|uniref:Transporter substrate-binding domain-containing protein n=2 Tax=Amycolatopsis pithecellobii TaxID=664692 RepID=A0A6N7Z0Q3_9PSEU|nr:transporter substrate-binding domain-containing protein [Amycolatopsis pithecellobii]